MQQGQTLIADRPRSVGSAEELLTVQAHDDQVDIDLRYFDPEFAKEHGRQEYEGLIARSFVTLPVGVMDEIAQQWIDHRKVGATA